MKNIKQKQKINTLIPGYSPSFIAPAKKKGGTGVASPDIPRLFYPQGKKKGGTGVAGGAVKKTRMRFLFGKYGVWGTYS